SVVSSSRALNDLRDPTSDLPLCFNRCEDLIGELVVRLAHGSGGSHLAGELTVGDLVLDADAAGDRRPKDGESAAPQGVEDLPARASPGVDHRDESSEQEVATYMPWQLIADTLYPILPMSRVRVARQPA